MRDKTLPSGTFRRTLNRAGYIHIIRIFAITECPNTWHGLGANGAMKRRHGVILPFASLLIFRLMIDVTLAKSVAPAAIDVVAAAVVAMIFACSLSFLSRFRTTPNGFAEVLLSITDIAQGLAKGNSAGMEDSRLRERMLVHRTQGKEP
ncbi:MAG: hypothetical protein KGL56_11755 [Alphaproteobacteria bacterium]|nr:hypothetical protein [Alphaproteobacteria bacterium]